MSYYNSIVDRIPSAIVRSVDSTVIQSLLIGFIAKKNVLLRYSDDDALPGYLSSCNAVSLFRVINHFYIHHNKQILGQLFGLPLVEIDLTRRKILDTDDFLRLLSGGDYSQRSVSKSAADGPEYAGGRSMPLRSAPPRTILSGTPSTIRPTQ